MSSDSTQPKPVREDKKEFDKFLEALENHFKPSRSLVDERYVFNTCI